MCYGCACVPAVEPGTFLKPWPSSVIKLDQMWFSSLQRRRLKSVRLAVHQAAHTFHKNCWLWCSDTALRLLYHSALSLSLFHYNELRKLKPFFKFSLCGSSSNNKPRMHSLVAVSSLTNHFHSAFTQHPSTSMLKCSVWAAIILHHVHKRGCS